MPLYPDSYEVHIGAFEGPMDLLLYLVQKNEVEPKDISLAQIADQYLEWLRSIPEADLSAAGEFLVMAARLMALKARELLPQEEQSELELQEFDQDREALIAQMLEYQKFKKVAQVLQEKEDENFDTHYRGRDEKMKNTKDAMTEVGVWQLFAAFQKTLEKESAETTHFIELDDVTIEDRQQHITNYLNQNGRALFEDLIGRDTRPIVVVVSFMAILEMAKTEDLVFRQSENKGAIWIYRRKNNKEYSKEMSYENFIYTPDTPLDAGLVETLQASQSQKTKSAEISLDQVMKTVLTKVQSGDFVSEHELQALLEGKEEEEVELITPHSQSDS
ncbi:MAG: segregation/condensation protein A [Fibrobacter sp.]|nr:segregation/condensation protein A [Fibrobacter sp.]